MVRLTSTNAALVATIISLLVLLLPEATTATSYVLEDDYTSSPEGFFSNFDFFTGQDPNSGFVAYADGETAASDLLIGYTDGDTNPIYIGADWTGVASSAGRSAIRITSQKTYNTGILLVADILHMPTGCGVWSSLWMVGSPVSAWPQYGEIDIIEGVNLQTSNDMTLHTDAGCAIDSTTLFTGTLATSDCDIDAPSQGKNQGCQIQAPASANVPTFGAAFNQANGGVYATEWTPGGFSIWFFSRNAAMPASLLSETPDSSTFGTPLAAFAGPGCDFQQHFQDMSIVLDTDFCGSWAGADAVWGGGGEDSCAAQTGVASCQDFVGQNASYFQQAYWEIAGLRVYQAVNNATSVKRDIAGTESGRVPLPPYRNDTDRHGSCHSHDDLPGPHRNSTRWPRPAPESPMYPPAVLEKSVGLVEVEEVGDTAAEWSRQRAGRRRR